MMNLDPVTYEAWYHTSRGAWIGEREFALLMQLLRPQTGMSLLDVGSGSGYFSRRFADAGLVVTGVEADERMLAFAQAQSANIPYIRGNALALPLPSESFDYVAAITSLCFVDNPQQALAECWRVARQGVVLGLLNRHSLLYWQKRERGGYRGARWDTWKNVASWQKALLPPPVMLKHKTAIFFPSGGKLARTLENSLPGKLPWGGFLAVYLAKRRKKQD